MNEPTSTPAAAPIHLASDFIVSHPLRIDLPDGMHLRFRDIRGAARSAVHWNCTISDEITGSQVDRAECKRLASGNSWHGGGE